MSVVSTLVLEKGQDDVRWIFKNQDSSSQRLFVLTNTAPGIVLEVDTAGAMKVLGSGQSLGTGYDHPLAGVAGDFDEDFLYAGTNTYPGRVVKVSKRTLRPVSTLTLPKGHDTVVALQSDGVFVYAATYSKPGHVVQIRKADMRIEAQLTLTQGEEQLTTMVHRGPFVCHDGHRKWSCCKARWIPKLEARGREERGEGVGPRAMSVDTWHLAVVAPHRSPESRCFRCKLKK